VNNLVTRTVSGVVFLCILISGIILHPFGFGGLFLFIIIAGLHEFYSITLPSAFPVRKILGYFTAILLYLLIYAINYSVIDSSYLWLLVIPVAILFISELYSRSEEPFKMIGTVLTGIVYVALPLSLITSLTLNNGNYDYRILLVLFVFLWSNDVGAYCFGMIFGQKGKHKLFERVSPKKSWEGFWGGIFVSLLAAFIISQIWSERYQVNIIHWYILAVIVSVFGTFGDLTESILKRSFGIKDSGKIIPGHGGILDRFDGALIAFPCAIAYICISKIFIQ